MSTIHTDAPEVRKIAQAAFPDYTGRKFSVSPFSGPMRLDSCWEGGSRSYFVILNLDTMQHAPVPENGTPFSNGGQILQCSELPLNMAVVEHRIFLGKDAGIAIMVNPANLNRLALPTAQELTAGERIVLSYTRSRKSSYNGRNRQQMAFDDSGFPQAEWETAKASCIAKGLLNRAGAITDTGKNAIGWTDPDSLKWTAPAITQ